MPTTSSKAKGSDPELNDEYAFDYATAKPNRFAAQLPQGGRVIVLEPDVARVFTDQDQVNAVLRALISTMPHGV